MARDYPLEKVRNIGIIAHIDASLLALLGARWNRAVPTLALLAASTAGKLPFSRPLSRIDAGTCSRPR